MTAAPVPRRAAQIMPWLLVSYAAASLLHFAHNAEHLLQYPNLPASWSRADICLAWCCVTAVGLLGYVLYRAGFLRTGLTALGIYGALGFGGLLHYTRAPISHHSAIMNFTIWTEVACAAAFLISVASIAVRQVGPNATTAA
ncbi:MAG TPA: hypothetical protein VNY25_03950 [Steroidobacteraceae bacterium]|jgi:hypothetical protein|nr:hypothetical protein [Steroidobacteraceae bacterium]